MDVKRKHSKKRDAILNALAAVTDHPSAEMLYNALKPHYPELSLGTVYRNLSVLSEEGLAVSVAHVDGHERYDAVTEPHAHFVCRGCHKVQDLKLDNIINPMYAQVNACLDCNAESYSLSFSGLCAECRAN